MTMACAGGETGESPRPRALGSAWMPARAASGRRYENGHALATGLSLAGHALVVTIFVTTASQRPAAPLGGELPLDVQLVAGIRESVESQPAPRAADEAAEAPIEAPDDASIEPAPLVPFAPEAVAAPPAPRRVERHERSARTQAPSRARVSERSAADGGGRDSARSVAAARGGHAGPAPSAGAAPNASYRASALAHLARFKRYPSDARDHNIVGVSVVRFTLSPRGEVVAISLARSSGAPSLDEATLAMVRRAAPFPSMSDGSSSMSITAGVNYDLR